MKIVPAGYKILKIPEQTEKDQVYQFLEGIGRVCYKSEDAITAESAPGFLEKLRNSKHWAMLEHYRFSFFCHSWVHHEIRDLLVHARGDRAVDYTMKHHFMFTTVNLERAHDRQCLLTVSATALNYLVQSPILRSAVNRSHAINQLFEYMLQNYPELMCVPDGYKKPTLSFQFIPLLQQDLEALPNWEVRIHGWQAVNFTISRGTCYDEQTKVLTRDGWKFFKDVTMEDEFLTTDDESQLLYMKPSHLVCEDWDGPMHHWGSAQVDLMVTPNHNMWLFDYDKRTASSRTWKFIKSEDANNARYLIDKSSSGTPRAGFTEVTIPSTVVRAFHGRRVYPELKLKAEPFFELLGLWITGGSCSYGNHRSGNRITITQAKGRIRNRIELLLLELGLPYYKNDREFRINSPQLFRWLVHSFLHEEDTKKTHYMFIPRWMFEQCSVSNLRAFLTGVIEGNGSPHPRGAGFQIYTASRHFAEDLVELAMMIGQSANMHRVAPRDREFSAGHASHCREQYVVSILTTKTTMVNRSRFEEHYRGKIYCVELPRYHRLYVMRNGKPSWCGNTHELVRHRNHCSYAMESTRYCNYSKGKFGSEITVVPPPGVSTDSELYQIWLRGALAEERAYFDMLNGGATAQIARELLPHSVKADIVVTAPFYEWEHIFRMRCPRSAHPAMLEIMRPLLKEMLDQQYASRPQNWMTEQHLGKLLED